ncbi:hypothetical protein CK215_19005 [Mesorhizobium sp. WSM3864]|uniref:hypothetical protein n=1 Tax=Mesorhizobium sp. WSM3864 TaxID=2029404 RepID=UPI000BAFD36C|nr:hypothetical protein [Mesorhizobium sp. WSM3864]PBB90817.1 hypothetical protein CK215_19005 [Mesorhizobium sp. WSM3864]
MAGNSLAARELINRQRDIRRILSPLVVDKNKIEIRPIGSGQNYTLGVISNGVSAASITDAGSTRVKTKVDGIYFNYYEVWVDLNKKGDYVLERAYLHIHQISKTFADKQLLCLHCDPLIKSGDVSYFYKRSPHLHVIGGSPDISKSHISICLNDKDYGGADVAALTKTLESAIKMIGIEIFPRYGPV